jgi:uncharacterized membrane protein
MNWIFWIGLALIIIGLAMHLAGIFVKNISNTWIQVLNWGGGGLIILGVIMLVVGYFMK